MSSSSNPITSTSDPIRISTTPVTIPTTTRPIVATTTSSLERVSTVIDVPSIRPVTSIETILITSTSPAVIRTIASFSNRPIITAVSSLLSNTDTFYYYTAQSSPTKAAGSSSARFVLDTPWIIAIACVGSIVVISLVAYCWISRPKKRYDFATEAISDYYRPKILQVNSTSGPNVYHSISSAKSSPKRVDSCNLENHGQIVQERSSSKSDYQQYQRSLSRQISFVGWNDRRQPAYEYNQPSSRNIEPQWNDRTTSMMYQDYQADPNAYKYHYYKPGQPLYYENYQYGDYGGYDDYNPDYNYRVDQLEDKSKHDSLPVQIFSDIDQSMEELKSSSNGVLEKSEELDKINVTENETVADRNPVQTFPGEVQALSKIKKTEKESKSDSISKQLFLEVESESNFQASNQSTIESRLTQISLQASGPSFNQDVDNDLNKSVFDANSIETSQEPLLLNFEERQDDSTTELLPTKTFPEDNESSH